MTADAVQKKIAPAAGSNYHEIYDSTPVVELADQKMIALKPSWRTLTHLYYGVSSTSQCHYVRSFARNTQYWLQRGLYRFPRSADDHSRKPAVNDSNSCIIIQVKN